MPGTTYYYTVDSTGPDGTSDGVKRTVNQFATQRGDGGHTSRFESMAGAG